MTLSSFINTRIGFGKFQIQCFLVLCLIDMNDGVQLVLSSFLNPIIIAIFPDASHTVIQSMASIFYLGILLGSVTSGLLADKYGRKKLIAYGSIMQLVISSLFYLAFNISTMFVLRFFYGFAFGFTVVITTSLFAQVSPQEYRGKGILLINFCISVGKIYAVVLGYIFLEPKLGETKWQLMMLCGALPNIIVFIGTLLFLEESPRYLMVHRQFQAGMGVLTRMLQKNKGQKQQISQLQKQDILNQFQNVQSNTDHHSLLILFEKKHLKLTLGLFACWIIINFCYYGQLVVQALHLGRKGSFNLTKYFFTIFGQIPSLLVSLFLIDNHNFGRKKSLIYFFIGAGIMHLVHAGSRYVLAGTLARFFMKNVFLMLYPLTTQSFETKMRTKGFGSCSGTGRIGAILMPFILFPMDNWWAPSVYILFCIISFVASFTTYATMEQTLNKQIDQKRNTNHSSAIEMQTLIK